MSKGMANNTIAVRLDTPRQIVSKVEGLGGFLIALLEAHDFAFGVAGA
jgi:hypothetical protein